MEGKIMIMIRNEDGQDICYVSWRVILLSLYYFGIYKNIRLKGKRRFSRKYFDKSFCVYVYFILKEYFREDEINDY